MIKVNNMTPWAKEKKYQVIIMVDGEAWFYDAWDDVDKAIAQATEEYVHGHVIPTSAVIPA